LPHRFRKAEATQANKFETRNVGQNKVEGDFAPERYLWVELESRIVAAVERDQADDMSRQLQYKCQL
jgi:hypothetical protein